MKLKRNNKDRESRLFWEYADKVTEEVNNWPEWKRSGMSIIRFGRSVTIIFDGDKLISVKGHLY